jgi:16S rRNA processing protein RimM
VAEAGALILGRITKPHGLRGAVKVATYVDDWAPFAGLTRCLVGPPGGPLETRAVETIQAHGRTLILQFGDVATPESARRLVGAEIAISRVEAPPPPAGTFYQYDILGLQVEADGRSLGVVGDILETPAHDVYVIRHGQDEWLLPVTRAFIRRIDPAAGLIELDPTADIAGLTAGGKERSAEAL